MRFVINQSNKKTANFSFLSQITYQKCVCRIQHWIYNIENQFFFSFAPCTYKVRNELMPVIRDGETQTHPHVSIWFFYFSLALTNQRKKKKLEKYPSERTKIDVTVNYIYFNGYVLAAYIRSCIKCVSFQNIQEWFPLNSIFFRCGSEILTICSVLWYCSIYFIL